MMHLAAHRYDVVCHLSPLCTKAAMPTCAALPGASQRHLFAIAPMPRTFAEVGGTRPSFGSRSIQERWARQSGMGCRCKSRWHRVRDRFQRNIARRPVARQPGNSSLQGEHRQCPEWK